FLALLQAYHINAIPQEYLGLHYAKDPHIPLDLPSLFAKCIKKGRGGYRMENGIFFNTILRTLGFSSYLAGARARPRVNGSLEQEKHSNITTGCTLSTSSHSPTPPQKYMMDIGFSGDMPIKPLPLESGPSTLNIGTQEIRLN
ncbi:hypothetical protein BKA81DRAFT_420237, partial [Phyllosticta paracitricarpa]